MVFPSNATGVSWSTSVGRTGASQPVLPGSNTSCLEAILIILRCFDGATVPLKLKNFELKSLASTTDSSIYCIGERSLLVGVSPFWLYFAKIL